MQLIVSMAEIAPKSNVVSSSSSSSDLKSEKKNALTDEASMPQPDVSTPDISDYTDHSRDAVASNNNAYASGYGTASKEPPFPVKLHKMLGSPEFRDIIAWLPHGRAWRVLQPKALEEKVIPLFFRHTRYSSFTRQVNGWGFRRVSVGNENRNSLEIRLQSSSCRCPVELTTTPTITNCSFVVAHISALACVDLLRIQRQERKLCW